MNMSERKPTNNAPGLPAAIGPYSQAMGGAGLVFLSGQLGLDPATGKLRNADFGTETRQVFDNLSSLAKAAGGGLDRIIKLNIFLTDLGKFSQFNEIAAGYLTKPYPARAAIEVAGLPKGGQIEIEGVMLASSD